MMLCFDGVLTMALDGLFVLPYYTTITHLEMAFSPSNHQHTLKYWLGERMRRIRGFFDVIDTTLIRCFLTACLAFELWRVIQNDHELLKFLMLLVDWVRSRFF